jgi:eukaryotic-like serine/threonine-protein kinase
LDSRPLDPQELFNSVLALPAGEPREAFLRAVCGDDGHLLAQVRSLLEAHAEAEGLLRTVTPKEDRAGRDCDTTLVSSRRELPSQLIGRYKLLQLIGEGGFGSVWMAEQKEPVKRRVALKIIKLGMDTRQVVARFEAERQALAMMDHPNIARVLDAGATEMGRPFFVMELCNGEPITEFCDKHKLAVRQRLEVFVQVCSAVQHAHQKGIIHRDIKPNNVLVSLHEDRPYAKVIDFGIAKATARALTEKTLFTEHRQLIGTPEYMSPEQAEGSLDIDTRTDIYSLGVLLYELLTGLTPYDPQRLRSAAYAEIQRIIREVEPERPSARLSQASETLPSAAAWRHTDLRSLTRQLRGELDWVVMKALAKERHRRYDTPSGLAADICRYLNNEPVLAGPASRAYRLRKLVNRNRPVFAAATAVAAALIVGLGAATYGLISARAERDQKTLALLAEAEQRRTATEQRDLAERSLRRLEAMQDFFLNRMFRAVDPDVSGGELITVREILDAAAEHAGEISDAEVEAAVRHEIGAIYHALGLYKDARLHLRRALDIREGIAAADARADTARTMVTLAHVMRLLQEPGRGEDLVRRARALRAEVHGRESLPVAEADYHLAEALYRVGRSAEAAEVNRATLAMLSRLEPAGQESSLHAQVLAAMGLHLSNLGQSAEAINVLTRALEIERRNAPAETMRLATALSSLGSVLSQVGRFDEAERRLQEALEIRRRILPPVHAALANSIQTLGVLKMRAQRPQEAELLVRESLDMYQQIYGARHEFVATTFITLGAVLASQGNFAEAAEHYGSAVQFYADLFPPDDSRLANARSQRGRCLTRLGQYEEAEQLLLEAHRALASTGATPPVLALTVRGLGDLYEAWGKPEQSVHWRARLHELQPPRGDK